MIYKKLLDDYVNDCRSIVESVDNVLANKEKDVTLTASEKFDYDFKKGLLDIKERSSEKVSRWSFGKNKNIYTGKTPPLFASQLFYLILSTADSYSFESTQDVLSKITALANNSTFYNGNLDVTINEVNNHYTITIPQESKKPMTFAIDSKESYVLVMLTIITEPLLSCANNTMMRDFFKEYLTIEYDKVISNTPPTPYIEKAQGIRLIDYFSNIPAYKPSSKIYKHQHSDYDISLYKQMAEINDECTAGKITKRNLTNIAEPTTDPKVLNEFYDSMLISPMGKGMHAGTYVKKKG